MGLNESSNLLYINVSKGKLITGSGENKKEFISYTGTLLKIEPFQDEYEGKPQNKIRLTFNDGEDPRNASITFLEDSWFGVGFFARILNIDFKKPFTLGVIQSDKNEKVSFCYLKQGDKKIEKHPDLVSPVKTTKKGIRGNPDTVEYDWLPFMEFSDKTTAWVKDEIYKATHTDAELQNDKEVTEKLDTVGKSVTREKVTADNPTDDDLPF